MCCVHAIITFNLTISLSCDRTSGRRPKTKKDSVSVSFKLNLFKMGDAYNSAHVGASLFLAEGFLNGYSSSLQYLMGIYHHYRLVR